MHSVDVQPAEGERTSVQAKNVIIATGSDAKMLPGLQADSQVLTNMEILSLKEIPKSMVVIGSGAVGVEFGSIFKSFGTDITIVEALPRLVPNEDEDVSKELARVFRKRGIESFVSAKFEKLEKTKTSVKVTITASDGKQMVKEVDKVLVAVGRAPRTADVGLDKTKIKPDRGFITVNEWMQTQEPGVYAIGDIVAGLPSWHTSAPCAAWSSQPRSPENMRVR